MIVTWTKSEMPAGGRARGSRLDAILMPGDSQDTQGATGELLASIEERFLRSRELGVRAFHQGIFWTHVDRKLDILGLDAGEREAIVEKIQETVPRPGKDWELYCVKCIPEIEGQSKRR